MRRSILTAGTAFATTLALCLYGPLAHAARGRYTIGSDEVAPGTYPFMTHLALQLPQGEFHRCGATLIERQLVMTAAHCVYNEGETRFPDDWWRVKVGVTDRTSTTQGQLRTVVKSIVHPRYRNSGTLAEGGYDIAFLKLNKPVTGVTPVQLPAVGNTSWLVPGKEATVAGWGRTTPRDELNDYPVRLSHVRVPFKSNAQCQAAFAEHYVSQLIFCAGSLDHDTCEGDSGGPLFDKVRGGWRQYGIVHAGSATCGDDLGGLYTNTASALLWKTLGESKDGAWVRGLLRR